MAMDAQNPSPVPAHAQEPPAMALPYADGRRFATGWWTVLGWVSIVQAIVELVRLTGGLVSMAVFAVSGLWGYRDLVWPLMSVPLGLVSLVLLAGGLRLRKGQRSGARLLVWYAWLRIGAAVLAAAVVTAMLGGTAFGYRGLGRAAVVSNLISSMAANATSLAFPLFLLIWFRRKGIRSELTEW